MDIIEKNEDIKKLEKVFYFIEYKSYEECFKIMTDIAFMVKEEGEMLDDIEANLNSA